MASQTRKQKYLWHKFQKCKALIAEKRATAARLEAEADLLEHRKHRLGIQWKDAVKNGD